jgi:hypothetical protein
MKLIIDINEELYEAYKGRPPRLGDEGMDMIAQAIANGISYEDKIEEVIDLLETEWGYEGIREDVSRILRGAEND